MCVSSFVLITDDWKFTAIFKNNYYFDNLTDTKKLFCDFAHLCINIIDPKWSPLIFTAEQCTRIWSLVYLLPSGGFFENWRFLYRLLQMLPTVCPVLYAKNPDYSAVLWSAKWINTHLDVCFLWIILFRSQDSWGLNFDPCNALNKSWISNTRQHAVPLLYLCLSYRWCGFTDSLLEGNQPTVGVFRCVEALGRGSLKQTRANTNSVV